MSLPMFGAGLLVAGGLMNAIPPVSNQLTKVFGGKPVVQILLGVFSVVVGFALLSKVM